MCAADTFAYSSDICEDAEIRERIEQLKTEQESKRLAEAQRRRVRRSQSNNTRWVRTNDDECYTRATHINHFVVLNPIIVNVNFLFEEP